MTIIRMLLVVSNISKILMEKLFFSPQIDYQLYENMPLVVSLLMYYECHWFSLFDVYECQNIFEFMRTYSFMDTIHDVRKHRRLNNEPNELCCRRRCLEHRMLIK